MSITPSGLLQQQGFYLSGPMPCPYLPAQVERKLFTFLTGKSETDTALNASLTRAGFRRSHEILYRPACDGCSACVPVRVPTASFMPSRSQKRLMARNRDLILTTLPLDSALLFPLFQSYQRGRHADSDMARMSPYEFGQMLHEARIATRILGLRDAQGELLAAMITDDVSDGASAVYSFFTPEQPKRSLGTQLILSLISEMRERGLPYVYLGYWIAASRKMAYKSRFTPLQSLGSQGWETLQPLAR